MRYPTVLLVRLPQFTLCGTLLCALASCCGGPRELSEEAPPDGETPPEPVLKMEENGGEVVRQLGNLQVGLMAVKPGIRTISWRDVRPDGTLAPKIRFSIGFWPEGLAEQLMGENFQEESWLQLSLEQCHELIQLISDFDEAQFKKPGDHIKYRDIRASYGIIHLRKKPDADAELHFSTDEHLNEYWVTLDPPELVKVLEESIERAETLRKEWPSVEWN